MGGDGQVNPGQQLTRTEVLAGFTSSNRWFLGGQDEDLLGTLEVGRLGDVVVLSDDYFAVRDPSAVNVKPLNRPPLANGFRHVKLAFNFQRFYQPTHDPDAELAAAAVEEACARVAGAQSKPSTAAFLMSIGLPIAREERFFDQIIGSRPAQAWEDFFHLMAAQCKGGE